MTEEVQTVAPLKSLRDLTAQKVVDAFPSLFTAAAEERAKEILAKRGKVVSTAWDVIDKLSAEKKKLNKPDRPGSKTPDGAVLVPDGYSDALLKSLKELEQKTVTLVNAFNNMADASGSGDKQKIDDAFKKLSEATDKASKGVKGGDAGDSDADA